MTVTVTVSTTIADRHHYNTIFAFDSTTGTFAIGNVNAPTAVDTNIKVQGTGSARARQTGTGLNGVGVNFTNTDLEGVHLLAWVNNLDLADTAANGGWRIRIGANGDIDGQGAQHWGEIYAGGSDAITIYNGFIRFCVNIDRPFDNQTGTPAALTGIGAMAIMQNSLTASSRDTWFTDEMASYRGIFVSGGTTAAPGNSAEIAANDRTNGRGVFKSAQNAFYVLGRVLFGDLANANSEFFDQNEVWLFEAQNVSGGFNGLEFTAGTGTNNALFGIGSGSAAEPEGSGGNFFKAVGDAPFSVISEDSAINVGFYGCTFNNPVDPFFDAPRAYQYDDVGTGVTNETRDAGDPGTADVTMIPATEAVGDYLVIGHEEPFQEVEITLSTAGVGGVLVWEYWNGSAWSALGDVTDETSSLTATGTNLLQFAVPTDWATTTVGGIPAMFYIRGRITTVYSTNPVGTQVRVVMSGRISVNSANTDFVRCTFAGMGAIQLDGGPVFRKNVVDGSNNSPRSGAIVLTSPPTENNFSDLTITNCKPGILLKNTTTPGPVDYNITDIQFSNNNLVAQAYDFDAGEPVGSQYFDVTANTNDTSDLQFLFFVAGPAAGDALYIGSTAPFSQLKFLGNSGNWSVTLAFEYWNGSSWTAFSGLTDGTDNLQFTNGGLSFITWTRPTNWRRTTVGDAGSGTTTHYFMRIRIATYTSHTTVPTAFYIQIPGDIRVDYPSSATVNINILGTTFAASGGVLPQVDNVNGSTVNLLNNVPISIAGLTKGTAVKIIATETVGTVTAGDVIIEGFASLIDAGFETSINYEEAWEAANPAVGLNVVVRARNQGIFWFCVQEDADTPANNTDYTAEMSSNAGDDAPAFPTTPALNDAFYFCWGSLATEQWGQLKVNVTTAMVASGTTLVWEYYNGLAYVALSGVVDGTNGLTTLGENIVSFTIPGDWAAFPPPTTGISMWHIRVRISVLGTITTVPIFGRGQADVVRYLPYEELAAITSNGLSLNAAWNTDTISTF